MAERQTLFRLLTPTPGEESLQAALSVCFWPPLLSGARAEHREPQGDPGCLRAGDRGWYRGTQACEMEQLSNIAKFLETESFSARKRFTQPANQRGQAPS